MTYSLIAPGFLALHSHRSEVLAETDFNISETARRLGMHRRTLARKLESRNLVMAHVVNTQLDAADIISMIASSFGLPQKEQKEPDFLPAIIFYLYF